jgi:fructose-1,6-bisphosphatase/inositol monophosphatase family enzyme
MQLISIASEVARKLESHTDESLGSVEYTKYGNLRDVVTQLDIELHELMHDFCKSNFSRTTFLSEEGESLENSWKKLVQSPSVIIVDPLDGSNNLVCGLKDYGFMACLLENGNFCESLVVLPNENQILTWTKEGGLFTSKMLLKREKPSASAYLAYAPDLTPKNLEARARMMTLLDSASAGIYRYGSACLGLYRTLIGAHSTFIGLQMRPWDVIPFWPILASTGAFIAYSASERDVSLLISYNHRIFRDGKTILSNHSGKLVDFSLGETLRLTQ